MQAALLLTIGLVAVIFGANWLVDGSVAIARRLKVSDLAIGLTVVAFGTSLPELTVNIVAAIQNQPAVAVGNVAGSNICNILLILGFAAVVNPLTVGYGTVWKEIPLCFLASVILLASCSDPWLDGGVSGVLSRAEGIMLLGFFAVFLYYTCGLSPDSSCEDCSGTEDSTQSMFKMVLLIVGGLIFLIGGGKAVVEGAVNLAAAMGISEGFVAATIVAIGTSLPELATSIVAGVKRKSDIAIGNVVGSNLFNIFFVLGISSVVRPLSIAPELIISLIVGVVSAALLFVCMFTGVKHKLARWEGFGLLVLYFVYLILQYRQ
jgi:cation:H+ antiporter